MKRTLIVTAHPDDETFGMGGTLIKMCKEDPKNVKIVTLCRGRDDRNALVRLNSIAAVKNKLKFHQSQYDFYDLELENVLMKDITKIIDKEIDEFKPERIFTVSGNDIHQDHKIVSHACRISCRPTRTNIKELYEFKIPETEPFSETYFDTVHDISDVLKEKQALVEMYTSENIPVLESTEKFKTIYRKFEI